MLTISLVADVAPIVAQLNGLARKQLPFALAQAVNRVAFDVMRAERAAMSEVFEHPRPFTKRSVLVDKATKYAPTAVVRVGDQQAAYLAPYEFGGLHHLPGRGLALLNPKDIRLDAFGQIRGKPGDIIDRPNVFKGTIKGSDGEPINGVWQRTKTRGKNSRHGLKLLFRFGDALPVHKDLGFRERARAVVAANFAAAFDGAIAKALATAK